MRGSADLTLTVPAFGRSPCPMCGPPCQTSILRRRIGSPPFWRTRGADEQQQNLRGSFLADVEFPPEARVLEVGCGTGVLTRVLAGWPNVSEVVGVDPAASLLDVARDLARELSNVRFEVADGRSLPFAEETFDVVVFDSTLCHVAGPEAASQKPIAFSVPMGGWPRSTATTRPPRFPSVSTIRCKPVRTPRWPIRSTIAGSFAACPTWSAGQGSMCVGPGAMDSSRRPRAGT